MYENVQTGFERAYCLMDTDKLKELSPCEGCPHWYDIEGCCRPNWFMPGGNPGDFECPRDVHHPRQEVAED